MEHDQEEFMLSSLLSKMGAQQGVNSAKDTLKEPKISKVAKTVDTAMITVTIVAAGNSEGDAAVSTVLGTMKPAPGATITTEIGSFFGKATNTTELTKAANERLSKDIIYIYWDDHGQFGNKNPRKTGSYSNPAYTGAKEYQSYNRPHAEDRKKEAYPVKRGE